MKRKDILTKAFSLSLMALLAINVSGISAEAAEESRSYQVTEENENPNLTMDNQPEASYWFPEELLEWTPAQDSDLKYNVSEELLAERVDTDKLTAVNGTQNADTKVMAISIMNANTSGNAPHGLNSADCNIFTYWQYVDELVYWGGSSGEGLIVPPSPDVTDLGHKNGVPVIGTVFFPQNAAGGKMEWLDTFLIQNEDGSFPMADKLAEVAEVYGFDGWFINQETEGTAENPLTREHANKMQLFIQYLKEIAPELRVIYYDSMTASGQMNWQNALTEQNQTFLFDEEDKAVADEMFLNFWWTSDRIAGKKLLEKSAEKAAETGIDPYQLYAGVDIQANGYNTLVRWDLLESSENSTYTSLGLYCPSWAYASSASLDEFHQKENTLWVNKEQDPSAVVNYSFAKQWRGISTYVLEKSALTTLPFVTNFNTGSGYSFFKNGEEISQLDWNNRSVGDVLPTYRWMIDEAEGSELIASFDTEDAWYGGTSLKISGTMTGPSVIHLYSADLLIEDTAQFTTTAKASAETELNLVLTFEDGTQAAILGNQKAGSDWTSISYDLSDYTGKAIRKISYEMKPLGESEAYELHFGNISIFNEDEAAAAVSNVTVEDAVFDEEGMYAGVRLLWESDNKDSNYEIYRVNEDESYSFLGLSNTECFYVNTLPRTGKADVSRFEVVPVNMLQEEGESASASMEWPKNTLPKADFYASQTLITPGSTVTFSGKCSKNTETISWILPGADAEQAEGEMVSVTYAKEGVYDVTVIAENSAGEVTKLVENCIYVSSEFGGELALLSQGQEAKATFYVNDNEAPLFAVDGNLKKKWCATGTPPHEIVINLGEVVTVSQIKIAHAEAGGESADMNTKAYTLSVSEDGVTYVPVVSVTQNTSSETLDTFAPINAQYVKLSVEKPTQGADTAARIYEIEVYGADLK